MISYFIIKRFYMTVIDRIDPILLEKGLFLRVKISKKAKSNKCYQINKWCSLTHPWILRLPWTSFSRLKQAK